MKENLRLEWYLANSHRLYQALNRPHLRAQMSTKVLVSGLEMEARAMSLTAALQVANTAYGRKHYLKDAGDIIHSELTL